jgi:hypothetical protein
MYNVLVEHDTGLIKDYGRDYFLTNNTIVVLEDGSHILTYSDLSSANCNVHQIEDVIEGFVGDGFIWDNGSVVINPNYVAPEEL